VEAQGSAELVSGLEKTWQMIQKTLTRLTPADGSSGMCSNMTSITAAKSPPFSVYTACQ
jgi:hypothetical protein